MDRSGVGDVETGENKSVEGGKKQREAGCGLRRPSRLPEERGHRDRRGRGAITGGGGEEAVVAARDAQNVHLTEMVLAAAREHGLE